jgi:phosphate-selective porin OprO/OprP
MYDAPTHEFLARETGLMIKVPELWGKLFIGRTKEGFSLNKVMVGYAGWTMERFTMNDASIPILADGIKWLGYSPKHSFAWNLGAYNDLLSEGQTFSTYSYQFVARPIWLPIHSEAGTLFHLGVNLRYGRPKDGKLQLRSRPEAFPAPYFVDTGKFNASASRIAGYEAYYRRGPWLFGSEYWWVNVSSPSTGNPVFHGGDVVATWLVTGETRVYNTIGGFFKAVSPKRPVFNGGPGAWELVARYSSIDLDSGTLKGGKFWRFTPMVNWHMSDNVRLEFAYGYGHLDRFNLRGNTHFFQTRVQLQL